MTQDTQDRNRNVLHAEHQDDLNADSITGEPGSHPVGTGAGAAGGAAGSSGAEALNPTTEDAYWRDNFRKRPYADETLSYDHYRPAYRYGWESRTRLTGRRWDEVERDLERGWRENRGESRLGWGDAKLAARDAWQRIERRLADERDIANAKEAREAGDGADAAQG
ncbi:MAG: hypothetical protein KFH98_01350 [Gemmatimonadetes bacterium]|nr:hypothetical protein [Gemmatimonadota bacterium]